MVQLGIQNSSNIANFQGFIEIKNTDSGEFCPNLQRPDAFTQEQNKNKLNINDQIIINPLKNDLKIPSYFRTLYKSNQPTVIVANGSNVNKPRKTPFIISLREWEGYVVEISNDTFIAKLINIKNKSKLAKESGKFKLSLLSSDDQSELQLGSKIRWTIDMEILPSGSRQNVSKVVLMDMPEITEEVIESAYKKAAEMTERLKQNEASK